MSGGGGQDHSPVRDLLSLWARKEAKEFGEPRRNFLVTVVICMEEESFPSSNTQANLRAHPCAMTKKGLPGPVDHQWR